MPGYSFNVTLFCTFLAVMIKSIHGAQVTDVEQAFAEHDEVFLLGDLRTPRNTRRQFIMVMAQSQTSRTRFEMSVDFRQPQVIIKMTDGDGREYQLAFPTRALHTGRRTRILIVFSKLSMPHNSVSLFIDCMDLGVDQTEVPFRRIFSDNMNVRMTSAFQWHAGDSITGMLGMMGCPDGTIKAPEPSVAPTLEVPGWSRSGLATVRRQPIGGRPEDNVSTNRISGEPQILPDITNGRNDRNERINGGSTERGAYAPLEVAVRELTRALMEMRLEMKMQTEETRALREVITSCDMCRNPNDPPATITRCSSNPCFPGVRCVDTEEGFRCGACPTGYYGNGVECRRHTTCADRPCYPGVRCEDTGRGYRCGSCPPGYVGDGTRSGCRPEMVTCRSRPCFPGVPCEDTNTGFVCGPCPTGYTGNGTHCEDLNEVTTTTFITYIFVSDHGSLDPNTASVSLILFNILSKPMNRLPNIITDLVSAHVSIGRLNKFLAGEDLNPDDVIREKVSDKTSFEGQVRSMKMKSHDKTAVSVTNGTFYWDRTVQPVLRK